MTVQNKTECRHQFSQKGRCPNIITDENYSFYSTGSKPLRSVLSCRNVVKSVKLGDGGIRFKSWPSFMSEFPSLESLRIENKYGQWWSGLSLTINQLPSILRNLFLLVQDSRPRDWSCDCLFDIPTRSDTFYLDEHLPHLETLELLDSKATKLDWVSHCPPSLTSLYVHHWKDDMNLPSSLIHFRSSLGVPAAAPPLWNL